MTSPESAPTLASAQRAMPSSPVLRMLLSVMVESVTAPCRLMPSAVVSRMRIPVKVRLVIGPSIQAPTFMCSIQMFDTVELLIAPPMPLSWSQSTRLLTCPKIAKLDKWTLVLTPAGLLATPQLVGVPRPKKPGSAPVMVEYHMPAPSTVTSLTVMWPGMSYVPDGIHTVPPARAGALAGDAEGARGLGQRRGDVLEVGEIDRVGGRGVPRVDLQLEGRAGRIGRGEQPVHLVEEVLGVAARRVGERVAAVLPAVLVGQREGRRGGAVDVQRERRSVGRTVRAIRDAVPDVDRVGRYRRGERDVLAGARQGHCLAANGLIG